MASLVYTFVCIFPELVVAFILSVVLGIAITGVVEVITRYANKGDSNEPR